MNNIYKTPKSNLDNINYRDKQVVEFLIDGSKIKLINTISGKETVYVNNKIISYKKNFGKHSIHQFLIDNDKFTLSAEVPSIMGKIDIFL